MKETSILDEYLKDNRQNAVVFEKVIADYGSRLCLGKGFNFQGSKKNIKLFEEVLEDNNLEDLIWSNYLARSYNGGDIVFIIKSQSGKCYIKRGSLNNQAENGQGITLAYGTTKSAVVEQEIKANNREYLIKSIFDTEKVETVAFYKGTTTIVDLEQLNNFLPDDLKVVPMWRHDLGFCPVFIQTNYPVINSNLEITNAWNNNITANSVSSLDFSQSKDTSSCVNMCMQINAFLKEFAKNLYKTKSKLIASKNQSGVRSSEDERKRLQELKDLSANDVLLVNGLDIKTLENTNTFDKYWDAIKNQFDWLLYLCGYATATSNAAQKTSSESMAQFSNNIETTNLKRQRMGKYWSKIIECYFLAEYGVDLNADNKYSFEIKKNIAIESANWRDDTIKGITVGAETPVDYILKECGITKAQAEQIWQENKAWYELNKYQIQMQGNDDSEETAGVSGVSTNKGEDKNGGGRPVENEK